MRTPSVRQPPMPSRPSPGKRAQHLPDRAILLQRLALVGVPASASRGRRPLRRTRREWGQHRLADRALLAVSELVTNAVNAPGSGEGTARVGLRLVVVS